MCNNAIIWVVIGLLLSSCQPTAPSDKPQELANEFPATPPPIAPASNTDTTSSTSSLTESISILGSYVGYFEAKTYDDDKDISWANKITIFADSLVGDILYGHSVVAGNWRPFVGNLFANENKNIVVANGDEPGDDRYDGSFYFEFSPEEEMLRGVWEAYKKLPVSEREFELTKRNFTYDPTAELAQDEIWTDLYGSYDENGEYELVTPDAIKYNASTDRLTAKMIENMYRGDLEVLRNTIYARHGYSFKNRRMRYVFDTYFEWYMPISTDIRDQLTNIEKDNIALIKRYETHAEAYYDAFGR